jgi:hypothetical protein
MFYRDLMAIVPPPQAIWALVERHCGEKYDKNKP